MKERTESVTNAGKGEDDSVRLYLNKIGEYDLLTAEDEVKLAKTIEAGLRAKAYLARRTNKLDAAERAKLQVTARHGKEAKRQFINANLRLVVSIAKRYRSSGLSLLDLIQEGNLGLIRAVEKFEYRKGFKFSTYGTWWIRQALQRAIADKSRVIRVPVHMTDTMSAVHGAQDRLWARLSREATPAEIAEESGISIAKVLETQELDATIAMTASLDRPVGDDTDAKLGDFITDPDAVDPGEAAVEALTASDQRKKLEEVLDCLSERDRAIILMRSGLRDGYQRTLDDVGQEFNLTRERIRQIEQRALKRIRNMLC